MSAGWALEIVDETGSTSTDLINRARAGAPDRTGLLARRQLQGRGRQSRPWLSPAGNLSFSLLVRPALSVDALGGVVFVAGLALEEALARHVSSWRSLTLKWPNDVMLDGGKLGGILIESSIGTRGDVEWIVAGFGANLAHAPPVPGRHASCLADAAASVPSAEAVAGDVLDAWDRWMAVLVDSFAGVRAAWLERAHRLGTALAVDGVEGRFAGLSDDGHLRLETPAGLRTVLAGDAVLLDPGSDRLTVGGRRS